MRLLTTTLLALAAFGSTSAAAQPATPHRPVSTYSIVAVDSATGEIGVAVQSHWFSVGSVVTWAEPGVGAVATQAFIDPAYGPRGLQLMHSGIPAPAALTALLRADADSQMRQVAMIDAAGRVAVPHRLAEHPRRREPRRQGLLGAGEHDAVRPGLARDGPRVHRPPVATSPPDSSPPSTPPRPPAATSAAASRRHSWW